MQKLIVKLAICLSGLMLLLFVLRTFVFPYPDRVIDRKFSMLSMEKEKINTLMLGASTIDMHYDPLLYDSLLNAAGLSSTSFNFGIAALLTPENQYLLEKILARDLPRLELILLEIDYSKKMDRETLKKAETARAIEMTDVKRAVQRIQLSNLNFVSMTDRWKAAKIVLSSVMIRYSSYDAIKNFAYAPPSIYSGNKFNFKIENGYMARGYRYYTGNPDSVSRYKRLRKHFRQPANQKAYLTRVKNLGLQRQMAEISPLDKSIADIYEEMIRQCNRKGIRVMLIVPSVASGKVSGVVKALRQRRINTDILDFMLPEKYPELYDIRNRADSNHLTYSAAEIATRELAKEVMKVINRE